MIPYTHAAITPSKDEIFIHAGSLETYKKQMLCQVEHVLIR